MFISQRCVQNWRVGVSLAGRRSCEADWRDLRTIAGSWSARSSGPGESTARVTCPHFLYQCL